MSDTDETALENLHRVRRHYSDKKQEAMMSVVVTLEQHRKTCEGGDPDD